MSKSKNITPGADETLEEIKKIFFSYYMPANTPSDSTHFMRTFDIFQSFQTILPGKSYTAEDVAIWLQEKGFKLYETADLRFEWIVKSISAHNREIN